MNESKKITEELKNTALVMAVNCVRNTVIENYHAGIVPQSKTGDYSDVKVVTPYGEIPWNELSRINDKEMKAFNIEVVNRIYTFLQATRNDEYHKQQKDFLIFCYTYFPDAWDEPKLDEGFMGLKKKGFFEKRWS